ncbi:2-hydroxyacid dehydrogenase [Stutzerimonas kirkiae]|uniref:Hydroxyacid dehydrogenase n=1 Tax=Stutzerimonas kirkiae TaxID=2211392 RepID=A0A4Q9R6B4_9GAMM|nr:2-hydroxyacid dehydrogenase [Stutzerimonas kirkiae]TBU96069.1 hydroxyacid dehydrogenase [Stutzerimonas kirkiae]TBV03099.1 hydroxyacid dehydrogenase [Stutzerimonas kirkiae]TBV09817.1 hydroxyacid dehydrogenase [Stutzerimonas kirkiae]TBV13453.1 hydroxyacid dehydrogenase [Stutzerimonas kirkiae]
MSRPRVLQVGFLTERFSSSLSAHYDVQPLWRQQDPDAFLLRHGGEFEALVTAARHGCPQALLERLPNVKAICSFGVGFDSIAVDHAHERGIQVSNTPDVLNQCVADLAIGLIIDTARRSVEADRFTRAGKWLQGNFPLGRRVSGKNLGIVGLGGIGKEVARRSSGFDMPVRYHNRHPVADCLYQYEGDLLELARWADFLVLCCPGGAATHHLISAEVLKALGPDGILINLARGSVVDEQALVAALGGGSLKAAGLDVYADEPRVPEALFELPNVVLLPHIGSATEETRLQMEELVLANLHEFFARGRVLTGV